MIIVGCGPGSAAFVTPAARNAVAESEVILGSQRLLDLFPESRPKQIALPSAVEPALDTIGRYSAFASIAVLVSGDPGLFSLAKAIITRFGRDRCEVIPAVSSLQAAFARLGLDWADVRIISAHGRVPSVTIDELASVDTVAIFAGSRSADPWTQQAVEAMASTHRLFVCENLTLPDENVHEMSPDQLGTYQLAPLTLLILVRRDTRNVQNLKGNAK
jgi:precorrin-6y C5,15-methyltransferase (decarboxylating) CbiE subunit